MSLEASSQNEGSQNTTDQLTVDSVINWQLPLLVILFISVVFVAIKTVVHRHESRTTYIKLQKLEKERDKLAAQWSRLKLEQATTLNQVRVEQYARWDLNMKMPKASEVKIIQQPLDSESISYGGDNVASSKLNAAKTTKVSLEN